MSCAANSSFRPNSVKASTGRLIISPFELIGCDTGGASGGGCDAVQGGKGVEVGVGVVMGGWCFDLLACNGCCWRVS